MVPRVLPAAMTLRDFGITGELLDHRAAALRRRENVDIADGFLAAAIASCHHHLLDAGPAAQIGDERLDIALRQRQLQTLRRPLRASSAWRSFASIVGPKPGNL